MKLENRNHIAAPQPLVWGVTERVERWPEWTPTVESVTRVDDGAFRVGSVAKIKQPGLPEAEWRVTELTPGERFTWECRVMGLRMAATHELEAGPDGTVCILRLEVFGLVAGVLWPLLRLSAGRALEQENAGLKAACEAMVAAEHSRS